MAEPHLRGGGAEEGEVAVVLRISDARQCLGVGPQNDRGRPQAKITNVGYIDGVQYSDEGKPDPSHGRKGQKSTRDVPGRGFRVDYCIATAQADAVSNCGHYSRTCIRL